MKQKTIWKKKSQQNREDNEVHKNRTVAQRGCEISGLGLKSELRLVRAGQAVNFVGGWTTLWHSTQPEWLMILWYRENMVRTLSLKGHGLRTTYPGSTNYWNIPDLHQQVHFKTFRHKIHQNIWHHLSALFSFFLVSYLRLILDYFSRFPLTIRWEVICLTKSYFTMYVYTVHRIHRTTGLSPLWASHFCLNSNEYPKHLLFSSEHPLSENTGQFPFCQLYSPQAKILGGFFSQQMNYKGVGSELDLPFHFGRWGEEVVVFFPLFVCSILLAFQQSTRRTVWDRVLKYKRGKRRFSFSI